jgi:V/A-type H+-transporting ATPase subunit G/H
LYENSRELYDLDYQGNIRESIRNSGVKSLNEERIQQIVKIEQQVQAIHDEARSKAEKMPLQAEQEVGALVEKARKDAEEEARRLVAAARAEEEVAAILQQAEQESVRFEEKALGQIDRAVNYVLARVVGRD